MYKKESSFSKHDKNDLFYYAFYSNIRDLKNMINTNIAIINNMYNLCLYGYEKELNQKHKEKLKQSKELLKKIYDDFNKNKENICSILSLYEGFGIIEIYESDTDSYIQRENPMNNKNDNN